MRRLLLILTLAAATSAAAGMPLTATQIVDKNLAARGGADAWHKVQSMVWFGHIVTSGAPEAPMRFAMEFKRPDRSRFEIQAKGQISARIYDGRNGWKVVQAAGGRPTMETFGPDDVIFARDAGGIGGPLLDYAAKGVAVSLEGSDQIEGRKAYRLALKLPSGNVQHVWIDAENFREMRYDRESRNAFGMAGRLTVSYRDFRDFDGIKLPTTIESGIGASKPSDKMIIDRVVINPPLEDNLFAKPNLPEHRRTVARMVRPPGAAAQMRAQANGDGGR